MTVPVTGITPVYGLEYLVQGEPARHTRAKMERNAKAVEAALIAGGVAAPGAGDVLAVSGRVSVLEAVVTPAAAARPYAILRGSGGTNILNGVWTAIPMALEDADPLGGHSTVTNTSRWTCPPGEGGLYLAGGSVSFSGSAVNRRFVGMRKNGLEVAAQNNTLTPATAQPVQVAASSSAFVLTPGEYLEMWAYQDSGIAAPGLGVNLTNSGWWLARLIKF